MFAAVPSHTDALGRSVELLWQDEDLVLCVDPSDPVAFDLPAFERFVETVLGSGQAPDYTVVVRPLPVTGRLNKVDKVTLRRHVASLLGRSVERDPTSVETPA